MASTTTANSRAALEEDFEGMSLAPKLARAMHEILVLRLRVTNCLADLKNRFPTCTLPWTLKPNKKIHVSRTSVKNMKRTTLQHLRFKEVHKGEYLILRTLEEAYTATPISTAVEDHEGSAVFFSVYNLTACTNPTVPETPRWLVPQVNDILPVGTVFILKEPYAEIAGNWHIVLRCDCPSNIIVLHNEHELFSLAEDIAWKNYIDPKLIMDLVWNHPKPKTALEWKQRGNNLYRERKFENAIRCYLLGLKHLSETGDDGPMVQVFNSNLSSLYLSLGFLEKALEFAEKVLMVEPANRQALSSAAKASYRLRKYEHAKKYYEKYQDFYPDDQEMKTELLNAKERCSEKETGEFDMDDMFFYPPGEYKKILDCADYVGPINVITNDGKSRVVASRDINRKTILVLSKALVFSRDQKRENTAKGSVNSENTDEFNKGEQLVVELAQLIAKNPNVFGRIVYGLSDGKTQANNHESEMFCDPDTKLEPIVDIERLRGILETNCLSEISKRFIPDNHDMMPRSGHYQIDRICGLFVVPSRFNRSNSPNATYFMCNNVVIVKAIKLIKKDEEIFLPYLTTTVPKWSRRGIFDSDSD